MKYNKLEYNSAVFLCIISLFLGVGANRIIDISRNDTWISLIIGSLLGLLIIFIFKKLNKDKRKYLSLIYNIVILCINLFIVTKLISSIYLNKTPDIMVMLPFLIAIYYGVNKGINVLFKVSSILFFVYMLITIIPVTTLVPTINIDNFKPILTNSWTNILIGAIRFSIISTAPITVFPNVTANLSYKTYIFACILLFIISSAIIGTLGVNLSLTYRYPEYQVFKNITLLGLIENNQNIQSNIWLISSFVLALFSSYNIKIIINQKGLIIIFIIIIFTFSKFLISNYIYTDYLINYYSYFLLLPIILYIFTKA